MIIPEISISLPFGKGRGWLLTARHLCVRRLFGRSVRIKSVGNNLTFRFSSQCGCHDLGDSPAGLIQKSRVEDSTLKAEVCPFENAMREVSGISLCRAVFCTKFSYR